MYQKLSDVDIIDTLQVIVDHNTEFYKTDFIYDKEMFQRILFRNGDTQNFLWLSRQSGTQCFTEHSVYLADTYNNTSWQHYNASENQFQAFLIKGRNVNGELKGDIYHLDYAGHQQEVQKHQQPWDLVNLTFKDKETIMLSRNMYENHLPAFKYEHGPVISEAFYLHDTPNNQVIASIKNFHEFLEANSIQYDLSQFIDETFTNRQTMDNMQF